MKSNTQDIKFLVTPGLRIVMLFLAWIIGAILMLFVSFLLSRLMPDNTLGFIRISVVFQDILMWILPAVLTVAIITRNSESLLEIGALPNLNQTILAVLLLIVSSPLMSWIITLNASVHLPESMAGIETALRAMEENAEQTVKIMLDASTPGALIVNILIIGVLAGFAEELFFRGTLQRILSSGNLSIHAAIWISSIIFSAMHFQFFGFVPRMLLGALFGYLLYWSGSLWLPILIHTLNNSAFVVLYHLTGSGEVSDTVHQDSWVAILLSAVLTTLCLAALSRKRLPANG